MSPEVEIVWLVEERTYAQLLKMGAFFSLVRYTREGIDYELLIENDDYEPWEGRAFEYESE